MRNIRPIIVAAALLLSACGASQPAAPQAAQPTSGAPQSAQPSSAPPTASPAMAPTEAAFVSPSSAPAPSPLPATEPTARLILPPGTPIPPATDAAQTAASTATPAAKATAVPPRPSATPEAAAPAQPPATVAPAASAKPAEPMRLVIGEIALDGRIVSVGLDKDRIPIVPKHDIGWYNLSARPGEGDNIVLWGHVLRFREAPKIPAPFARLKQLKPGAGIVLYDRAGEPHTYTVTKQIWATPDQVEYIRPKGSERVTLISCIGDKVMTKHGIDMTHRLVTIAEPLPPDSSKHKT